MTKLQPYPDYKASGIDWLSEVPIDWEVDRIKTRVGLVTDRADEQTNPIALENIEGGTGRFIESETEFAAVGVRFERGDVLFGKLRPYLAKSWMADRSGEAVGDFFVMRPMPRVNPRFLNYVTLSTEFLSMVDGSTFGSKMPRASWDFIANIRHPFPDLEVQIRIADFLDHETEQIDALIARQERLIELLGEKRQAIITHAVTKGLDPDAPTKPSGIPWLGEIPAHWRLTRLAEVTENIVDCLHTTPEAFSDGDYWVVRTSSVRNGRLDLSASFRTDRDTYQRRTNRLVIIDGDILLTREAPAGEACIVEGVSNLCLGQRMVQLRPRSAVVMPKILLWNIYSDHVRTYFDLETSGSMVQNLTMGRIGRIPVVVPPIEEQHEITTRVSSALYSIDDSTARAQRLASLLHERRSALISAAVTGKINVTNEGVTA